MDNEIVESAKEVTKAACKALDISEKLGGFLTHVFGTLPEDVVGIIIGDWLHQVRIRNLGWYAQRTEEILKKRGIKTETKSISPSIALPLFRAAQDETRDELRELWARMIVNAMDSSRSSVVRQTIIATVKIFEPLDAIIMQKAYNLPLLDYGKQNKYRRNVLHLPKELAVSQDEFEVSIQNLYELNCIQAAGKMEKEGVPITPYINFTSFGREVLRACSL